MSRKHYRQLAEAIREAKERGAIRDEAIELIGDVLHRDNSNFKWDVFAEACGVGGQSNA